ncbi:MAG: 50S ribosomal protein L13 [Bacteroidales bacterium]|nr:50S ribosomal protein L13 [Bacteroidales bacterium]
MDTLSYKTSFLPKEKVEKRWYLIDATGIPVGRLASRIAFILRGKNKPNFTPNVDCGDNVIVINCEKVVFTGKKMTEKKYVKYTGYPGGQRFTTPSILLQKNPKKIIEHAVKCMLPKNRLGRKMFTHLKVYVGENHPHKAQKPEIITFEDIKK